MNIKKSKKSLQQALLFRAFTRALSNFPSVLIYPTLVVVFYWQSYPNPKLLLLWLGMVTLSYAIRQISIRQMLTTLAKPSSDQTTQQRVTLLLVLAYGLNGIMWGCAAFYFYIPEKLYLFTYLYATIFGLTIASVLLIGIKPIVFASFVLPIVTGACLRAYISWDIYSAGIMLLIFLLFFFAFGKIVHASIQDEEELLNTRLSNEKLIQNLSIKTNEAEKANLEKSRFLAAASHDLRQPLHATGLFLHALSDEVSSSRGEKILQQLQKSNEEMGDLFNAILDISKLDTGNTKVRKKPFDIHILLDDVCGEFNPTIKEKGLELVWQQGEPAVVKTDFLLLRRVLSNLLLNAIAHSNHGTIKILTATNADNTISIHISDQGVGIPESEIENIFSEYHQLHNPERDRKKGLGLGLAIVKRICELLAIKIDVQSDLGVGSTFILTLDLHHDTIEGSLHPEPDTEPATVQKKILVIEDDIDILAGMEIVLKSWGCESYLAEGIDEAVTLLQEQHIDTLDLIIADYRLRENTTGIEAIIKIRAALQQPIPAIVITGDTKISGIELLEDNCQLLHKPLTPHSLMAAITALEGTKNQ